MFIFNKIYTQSNLNRIKARLGDTFKLTSYSDHKCNVVEIKESDTEQFEGYECYLCEMLSKIPKKVRERDKEMFEQSPKFPGDDMFIEYPHEPDILSALCLCNSIDSLKEIRSGPSADVPIDSK